jgi:DNA-directed RNA polymerase subunit F
MISENKISEKPVSLTEIKQLLSGRKKEKELTYEQDLTLKYAKKFAKVTPAQLEKIKKELSKIEKLDEAAVIKLIDILPSTKESLELVIPKNVELEQADIEAILDVTKKYAK